MDSHLFRLLADYATPLLAESRVDKIREPAPGLLVIALRVGGKNRYLYFRYGRSSPFWFIDEKPLASNAPPPAPVVRLRKYFSQKRIAAVVSQYASRKLWLLADLSDRDAELSRGKAVWMCLDLEKGPSLWFLDAENAPTAGNPQWPDKDALANALDNWRDWPILTPALRKELNRLETPDGLALLEDLKSGGGDVFLYKDKESSEIVAVSAWPLEKPEWREQEREDILAAFVEAGRDLVLTKIARETEERRLAPERKKARKIRLALERLDEDETRLKAYADDGVKANVIRANLWRYGGDFKGEFINAIDPVAGAEEKISLNPRYNLRENMERLFARAAKAKRGLPAIAQRRERLKAELSETGLALVEKAGDEITENKNLPARLLNLQKSLPKNIQAFLSSDGFILLRGKDAKGNRALKKHASPHDIWTHVLDGPGAHVVARRPHSAYELPEKTLAEAGALAVNKSWAKDAAQAMAEYAELRHVRPARKGPAGLVIIDKVLLTRSVYPNPELETRLSAGRDEK